MDCINNFLEKNKLSANCFRNETEIKRIELEMTMGLKGGKSSLQMIPSYQSVYPREANNKPIIVLDAGGTNLRVSLITVTRQGELMQEAFAKHPMPGTNGAITKEAFFDSIAQKIVPLCDRSDTISFCFSFAAKPLLNHDATVYSLCKEIQVEGISGANVCEELSKALKRQRVTKKFSYFLLNDSVASLLGGYSETKTDVEYDGYIGLIWGTGFNVCYTERTRNIPGASTYPFNNMIVNMEAGSYAGFARGRVDIKLDEESVLPGDHQAEKMIGGAYLGDVILTALHNAAEEGLLTSSIVHLNEIKLSDVDCFLSGQENNLFSELSVRDIGTVRKIIISVYERAAMFVSYILVAAAERIKLHKTKARVLIVADGSTLLKSDHLKRLLERCCDTLCANTQIKIDFLYASEATIRGTAQAAL